MGFVAILVMWLWLFEGIFVPLTQRASTENLASIGPVPSEEKISENVDRWTTWRMPTYTTRGPYGPVLLTRVHRICWIRTTLEIHACIGFHLCKSITKQIWPCHKNDQGQPYVISWTNSVALEYLSFKVIVCLVPKKEIFEGFYHIWAPKPSWSCDLEHLNNFHPNIPWRLNMKFGFNRPSVYFLGKQVWKCWIWVTLDKWMTLTFDIHKDSCTALVDCMCQLWYHRLN